MKKKFTAYMALNGNDETAVLDDMSKPYQSWAKAMEALKPHAQAGHPTGIEDMGYLRPDQLAAPVP